MHIFGNFGKYPSTAMSLSGIATFALLISISFLVPLDKGLRANAVADVEMWRLDCGEMEIEDISYFSDVFAYDGRSTTISNGCYLIRNGTKYLLWDAGLAENYLGNTTSNNGWTSSISITIADQLQQIDLEPADVDFLGVSHFHGDHIGQAIKFAKSTLLINRKDADWIRSAPSENAKRRLSPWFEKTAPITDFTGDHDVFGDGSVIILATPGHTPGHSSLLVKLKQTGPVLLTGDLFHLREELGNRTVSRWNHSRAETLASIDRFNEIAEKLNARVIVQHDPLDTNRLPAFPASAK